MGLVTFTKAYIRAFFAPLVSGKVPTANLGAGTADNTKFLRGDQTWAVPSGGDLSGYALLSGATFTGDVQIDGNDLSFGLRDGRTYRPVIVHYPEHGILDIEYNGQASGSTNSEVGSLLRFRNGNIQFLTKPGDGATAIRQTFEVLDRYTRADGVLAIRASAPFGNLLFQGTDTTESYQQFRVHEYGIAVGHVPTNVGAVPGALSLYGSDAKEFFRSGHDATVYLLKATSTGDTREVGSIERSWIDSTDATRKGYVDFFAWDTAKRFTHRSVADGARGHLLIALQRTSPADSVFPDTDDEDVGGLYWDGTDVYLKVRESDGTFVTRLISTSAA